MVSSTATSFVVTNGGNVGIAVMPDARLTIKQSNNSTLGGLQLMRSDTTGYGVIYMGGDDALYIQNQQAASTIFYTNATEKMRITSAGNVGIGTTSPSSWNGSVTALGISGQLVVGGGGGSGNGQVILQNANTYSGSLCYSDLGSAFSIGKCTASSLRYKQNIQDLPLGLNDVLKLRPVTFDYKPDYPSDQHTGQVGFIAEEVAKISPLFVLYNASGTVETVRYEKVTALLAQGIKDLDLRLENIASTAATTTTDSQSFAASFFQSLFTRIIAWLANAQNGVENLFAKNLYAENIEAKRGTFDELCVKDDTGVPVCVTGIQLRSLLSGSVLAASASSNDNDPPADAEPVFDETADERADPINAASSTPPAPDELADPSSQPEPDVSTPSPANDNDPAVSAVTEDAPGLPANDNPPLTELPGAGTE